MPQRVAAVLARRLYARLPQRVFPGVVEAVAVDLAPAAEVTAVAFLRPVLTGEGGETGGSAV